MNNRLLIIQNVWAVPQIVIGGKYALWRTETLNFSIRKTNKHHGSLRHLGWEDPDAREFTKEQDVNGIVWENFAEKDQLEEIYSAWPNKARNGLFIRQETGDFNEKI